MQKQKGKTEENDPWARRKAAAWAWYQHANRGAPRLDRGTCSPTRQPSRFKANTETSGNLQDDIYKWDCGSPLYDSFELVALCNQLERGLTPLHPSSAPSADHNWYQSTSPDSKRRKISHPFCFCISPDMSPESEFGMKSDCKKKRHPFRWLFRLSLSISHALAVWTGEEERPRHGHYFTDFSSSAQKKMVEHTAKNSGSIPSVFHPNSLQNAYDSAKAT
eukprot:Gb_33471 [translate_table: standard]